MDPIRLIVDGQLSESPEVTKRKNPRADLGPHRVESAVPAVVSVRSQYPDGTTCHCIRGIIADGLLHPCNCFER